MTNTKALNDKIKKSGLKKGFIVKELGISYHWFKQKIQNQVAFKAWEIQKLCQLLDIVDLAEKEAIFFAFDAEKNSTNKEGANT